MEETEKRKGDPTAELREGRIRIKAERKDEKMKTRATQEISKQRQGLWVMYERGREKAKV